MENTPELGSFVTVNKNCPYQEWNDGTRFRVVGLALKPDGKTVDVTIAGAEPRTGTTWSRFSPCWDEPTDGFPIEQLDAAEA
jgi:hypothetical protein